MGGERPMVENPRSSIAGSSPRGRGTLTPHEREGRVSRIIPAWAGNAGCGVTRRTRRTDHPRVGGERFLNLISLVSYSGSSPRGRGTRVLGVHEEPVSRIIPAWAGNARAPAWPSRHDPDHPRVGGERGTARRGGGGHRGSSPRGRGTLTATHYTPEVCRIIPAWAGNA